MTAEHDASSTRPQVTSEEGERFFALLSDADRHRIWDRMLKPGKAPPPDLLAGIPTDFDRTFQEIVPAKLEGYIRLGAYMVRLNLETFTLAHNRVMRAAMKYGAEHLSRGALHDLEDWIDQQILACIDEPPPEGVVTPEQLARIRREVR